MNPADAPLSKLSPEVVLRLAQKHLARYGAMQQRGRANLQRTGSASPYRLDELAAYLRIWSAVAEAGGRLDEIGEAKVPSPDGYCTTTMRAAACAEVYDAAMDEGLLDEEETL